MKAKTRMFGEIDHHFGEWNDRLSGYAEVYLDF